MATKKPYTANDVADYLIHLASQECVGDGGEREELKNLFNQGASKNLTFAKEKGIIHGIQSPDIGAVCV